jgi:uncharacterized protein YxjI
LGIETIVAQHSQLIIRQKKEWGEIILGFESTNKYEILDESGNEVGFAAEEAGGIGRFFARNLLGKSRPCTIHVYDADRQQVATGKKPFRLYFHEMAVHEGDRFIGTIKRHFKLFGTRFTLSGPSGNVLLEIHGGWFRIWTFRLLLQGKEIGFIRKKWAGFLKEMFSDADTFGIEFSHPDLPLEVKELLLVATFLIDFTCFEENQRN